MKRGVTNGSGKTLRRLAADLVPAYGNLAGPFAEGAVFLVFGREDDFPLGYRCEPDVLEVRLGD